jgi:hypothetical protein
MTRLGKKCFVGSAFFHGLTVAVFIATAAFRTAPPPPTSEQVLTLVPGTTVVDTATRGGGGPAAPAPIPAPVPPRPQPVSTPPPSPATHPPSAPVPPPRQAQQPAPAPRRSDPAPTVSRAGPDPAPQRNHITPTFASAATSARSPSRNTDSSAQTQASQAAAREAGIQRAQEIKEALASLGSSVRGRETPVSVATLPGEGGGDAFVNYRDAVFSAYYHAWKTPEASARSMAVADVKIVVSRNGDVLSSDFVSKSGDAAVDKSIQRALDQVERQKLPSFPPTSSDDERTFLLRFDLQAKQSAG